MKVLYFSREYTTHDRRFLSAIVQRGYSTKFLALEGNRADYASGGLPDGVSPVGSLPLVEWARSAGQPLPSIFREILESANPDIVMAGPITTCAAIVAESGFSPLVAVSWGSDILVDSVLDPATRRVAETALKSASLAVCDNAAVEREMLAIAGSDSPPIIRFPWGPLPESFVSDKGFAAKWRRSMGLENATIVLCARAWHLNYGVDVVVDAFCRALARAPSLRLVLAGDGEAASAVRRQIDDLNLGKFVHCLGQIPEDDLARIFHSVNIYCAATPSDGSSVALLQALAAGLPVVVTDNPGNQEWVSNGVNGYLAPVQDADAFAEALLNLASAPEMAAAMGDRGRAIVRERSDWKTNVDSMLDQFERLVRDV